MTSLRIFGLASFVAAAAMGACGGKVVFDGKASAGGAGGTTSSSSVVAATSGASTSIASSTTSVVASSSTNAVVGSETASTGMMTGPCTDKATCAPCCQSMFPAEFLAFEKDLLLVCGCVDPMAPCASVCAPGGACVDPTVAQDPMSTCHQCLQGEIAKFASSVCLVKTITGNCTNDCPSYAACVVDCST